MAMGFDRYCPFINGPLAPRFLLSCILSCVNCAAEMSVHTQHLEALSVWLVDGLMTRVELFYETLSVPPRREGPD